MLKFTYVFTMLISATLSANTYDGYKVYRIKPATDKLAEEVAAFQDDASFDFWSDVRKGGSETDVMVRPESQGSFEEFLKGRSIEYSTLVDDVKGLLEHTGRKFDAQNDQSQRLSFKQYHRFDSINGYLKDLAKAYPKVATLETVGKSYEKRDIIAIKVSSGGNSSKPAILIDGGIHAREWISPATVIYLVDQLVTNKSNSEMYKAVDWYIIPVLNPDGYEYTHIKDRLWRKTRSPGKICNGTDANRNFDHQWGVIGASSDECSLNYKGKSPHSEVEILSLVNYAKKLAKNLRLYINVHSYGQYLLYPWCYTAKPSENALETHTVASVAADAIRKINGTSYTIGGWYETLYPSSGTSIDYMYGILKVPLAYTLELPDRGYGFVMPPELIEGVVKETFAGFEIFGKYVSLTYGGSG